MHKQKLYFVGDKHSPRTKQYVAVGPVRADMDDYAAEVDGIVYTKMIKVKDDADHR